MKFLYDTSGESIGLAWLWRWAYRRVGQAWDGRGKTHQRMQVCTRHCEPILVPCEKVPDTRGTHSSPCTQTKYTHTPARETLPPPVITMFSLLLPALAAFSAHVVAQTHGAGAEGTEMGPVAFLWPPDRNWTAQADNIAPCGSPDGPSNRTEFPLSQGAVALTIADEAWNVAIRLATGNGKFSVW